MSAHQPTNHFPLDPGRRQVRRLRLRAPNEGLARRGAILLEDALRTASLPDGGRVLLVRSLALGSLHIGRSPAALALLIACRFEQLAPGALHALSPGAAAAPAVFFHDAVEPYARLAARLAEGGRADEWFWPMAAPPYDPRLPRAAGMRLAVRGALATPAGPGALVAMLDALAEGGALDPLLAALEPRDGPALLDACGLPPAPPSATTDLPPEPQTAWRGVLAHWAYRWAPGEPLAVWLAAMALVAREPARLLDSRLPAMAAALARAAARRGAPQPPDSLPPEATVAPVPAPRPSENGSPLESADAPLKPKRRSPPHWVALARPNLAEGEEAPKVPEDGRLRTACGGLLFLVAPLARLGIARRLAEEPELVEQGLPLALLRHVAARLGVPPGDPLLVALGADPAAVEPVPADAPATGQWLAALCGWLRRRARLGLSAVVLRPSLVRATRSHIDLWFPLGDVDLRIRRAGLDIDPGWVPWLGRVVVFHYEARG